MTGELFPDEYDCGCRRNGGHLCRPLWVTEEEWGQLPATKTQDQVVFRGNKSARSGDPLGKDQSTPGLTTPDVTRSG